MNELYQKALLNHNRDPHHYFVPEQYCCHGKAYNPRCGDDLDIYIRGSEGRGREGGLEQLQVYFSGDACAVATASASMMTQALAGLDRDRVQGLCDAFVKAIEKGEAIIDDHLLAAMEDILPVRNYTGRHGCATLAWKAVLNALFEHEKNLG